jgi:hypothetical protein
MGNKFALCTLLRIRPSGTVIKLKFVHFRGNSLGGAHQSRKVVSILPFVRRAGTIFDDNATKIMGEAFDSACKELHDKGQPQIVYEVIAKRIIDAAKKGERDPIQLRKAGLTALGLEGNWTR